MWKTKIYRDAARYPTSKINFRPGLPDKVATQSHRLLALDVTFVGAESNVCGPSGGEKCERANECNPNLVREMLNGEQRSVKHFFKTATRNKINLELVGVEQLKLTVNDQSVQLKGDGRYNFTDLRDFGLFFFSFSSLFLTREKR